MELAPNPNPARASTAPTIFLNKRLGGVGGRVSQYCFVFSLNKDKFMT